MIRICTRSARVGIRVLCGCYVAGRRRRPGEHVVALADEARLLVGDGLAELLPDRVDRNSGPLSAPIAPEAA